MKAVTFQGMKNVEVKDVPDPKLHKPDDIIVKITATAICGSDLHLIHNMIPNLPRNYIIGHEPMGIVEEAGPEVRELKKGDRVVVPFNVSCGECYYCKHGLTSQCDNSNPHGESGAYFGYSETAGGYPGGQAEYMRVPYANFTPFKIPEGSEVKDESLVLLADVMPTAYWSVENAGVKPGSTVIVLGCGPIGLLAQRFCWMLGAIRVIAVDCLDYRLEHAAKFNHVETVNFEHYDNVGEYLKEITHGGADIVIDCVGMDGKMTPLEYLASGLKIQGGALGGFIIASQCVRKGGMIQVTGVYGGKYNGVPLGDLLNRNINIRLGQAPVIPYIPRLYQMLAENRIDPGDIVTHHLPLGDAKRGYEVFDTRTDGCIKVVMHPGGYGS